MPTKTEAIKRFLDHKTHKDLAQLYHLGMECQVNVAKGNGERTDGEFKGKRWHGWTDGFTTWKSFRIPYGAMSEPEYEDAEIKFPLEEHVEGIGMTGWNWQKQVSQWVAFDFDAIIGHSSRHTTKHSQQELRAVEQAAADIPWVTIRKSTSGKGLHIYVFVDDVETENHNEHAALARAILGSMSALAGFDFESKVDICGGNMWVWHRKMEGSDGLELIKQGSILDNVPANWKDHIDVIRKKKQRNLPQIIDESARSTFEELTSQRPHTPLDSEHKRLIEHLRDNDCFWWWDQDSHMLVCHTKDLESAAEELNLKGIFRSSSTRSSTHNAFAFPLRKGAWCVRRYSRGVKEHSSWDQDGQGWTRSFLNKPPDLATAARTFGGIEDEKGGFNFREAEIAAKAAALVGVHIEVDPSMSARATTLREHKDGKRLIAEVQHDPNDLADKMLGWLVKKNKPWTRIYNADMKDSKEPDAVNYDDIIRHLVTETGDDYGWLIFSDGVWRAEPLAHVKLALQAMDFSAKEVTMIAGSAVAKAWKLVNKPFQSEYPGDREWNRTSAQLRFAPTENRDNLTYPHWLKILNHCGEGLNEAVKENHWCQDNAIFTGADYLKCWLASIFQKPLEPLPYLFFYGPQNSGKSIFHEAFSLLVTKGYQRADLALSTKQPFNGEIEGAILCVVEETDLGDNKTALNRIKDWVTSLQLLIRHLYRTPYHIPNSTHWVQCSNNHKACPIFPGDTRVTMSYVPSLKEAIPKRQLMPILEKEAPDFLAELLALEIPESQDRLNVPVLATADKQLAAEANQTRLEEFIGERCRLIDGHWIRYGEFYEKFMEWLEASEQHKWSKRKVGSELPPQIPKGRSRRNAQYHLGNIAWLSEEDLEPRKPYRLVGENLDNE